MFSRQQYMNNECTFEQYFRQFVTPMVKEVVYARIGMKAINASTDQRLNDIPLARWDELHQEILTFTHAARKEAGEGNALSGSVCIAKQAARMLQEDERNGNLL